jgi:hypothetical protein
MTQIYKSGNYIIIQDLLDIESNRAIDEPQRLQQNQLVMACKFSVYNTSQMILESNDFTELEPRVIGDEIALPTQRMIPAFVIKDLFNNKYEISSNDIATGLILNEAKNPYNIEEFLKFLQENTAV